MRRVFTTTGDRVFAINPRAVAQEYDAGEQEPEVDGTPEIAVLCIEGPLEQRAGWFGAGYDTIRGKFEALLASDASAIVLKINSPGGDAAGNIECARAMVAAKEAAGKTVWAFADEAAYSAAYALACVADRIYLPDTGGVGSIGCLCVAADITEAVRKAGINAVVVRSGERKAEGHPLIPLDDATLERFQERVDGLANVFAEFVASQRGGKPGRFLALKGACLYGADAVKAGIADGVMSLDAMLGKLAAQLVPLDQSGTGVPSLRSQGPRAQGKKTNEASTMTLEQLKAALAAAQAAGDSAKVASLQSQIEALRARSDEEADDEEDNASDEDAEEEESEEDSEDDGDDEDEDDDEPEEEEEETRRSTTTKTYRRSKKQEAALAASVREIFPDLTPAQIKGRLMALRDSHATTKKLEARVKTLTTQSKRQEVQKLVSRGVREGKIPPAQREYWASQGMKKGGVESLKEYLATAAAVVPAEGLAPSFDGASQNGALTVLESTIATKMGVSTEAFVKQKALMGAGTTGIILSRVGT